MPGLIRNTFNRLGRFLIRKSVNFLIPSGLSDALIFGDAYRQQSVHGYNKNVYVHASIRAISWSMSGIPWILFHDRTGNEIERHPLLDLLQRPNPMMGGSEFTQWLMGYFLINGNSFIHAIAPDTGANAGRPTELWPLRPDLVEPKKGSLILGQPPILNWLFRPGGGAEIPIPFEDILHLRTFNPLDKFKGLSPISVAALSITQGNESKRWNVMLLQNQARPPGAFIVEGNLTEDQRRENQEAIDRKYAGPDNAGRPILLEGGMTWQNMGLSPTDMDWLEGQKITAREIALIFGVPPELIGDASNKTYSNFKEARRAFYEETILPTMIWLREEYNGWLVPKFGPDLRLDFNTDMVSALQEDRAALFERMDKATFLTLNEKRDSTGFEPIPGGDVILVPLNLVPLGTGMSAHDPEDEDKKKPKKHIQYSRDGETPLIYSYNPEAKQQATSTQTVILSKDEFPTLATARKWVSDHDFKTTKHDETEDSFRFRQFPPGDCRDGSFRTITLTKGVSAVICRKKEGRCALPNDRKAFNLKDKAQKLLYWKTFDRRRFQFLTRIEALIVRRLNADFTAASRAAAKAATPEVISDIASKAVKQGIVKWTELYEAIYLSVGDEFATDVFRQVKGQLPELEIKVEAFDEEDFRDIWQSDIRAWVQANSTTRILGIVDTSIRSVQGQIQQGIELGEGVPQIAKRLLGLKNIDTPRRARLIARTELISASNLGSQAAATATKLPLQKEWVATPDERVRETHAEVDGQTVDGMDSAFQVDGEELLFPGDTSLGATGKNIFNCRCTVVYKVMDTEEAITG